MELTAWALIGSLLIGSAAPLAAQKPAALGLDWTLAHALKAGSKVTVVGGSSPATQRLFVAADESSLTLLRLADLGLSKAVRSVLTGTATNHPALLTDAAQAGKALSLDHHVRVLGGVLSVGDHEYGQIIERIARRDIETGAVTIHQKRLSRGQKAAVWSGVIAGSVLLGIWAWLVQVTSVS